MGLCFEPTTYRRNEDGERFHHNKWRHYFSGRHRPTDVLTAVEARYPGANDCLRSPLWEALTPLPLTRRQLEDLVLPLRPDIQAIVRRRGTDPRPRRFPRLPMDRGLAEALERRASLDALAAAIIMVRIAHVEGETAAAYWWGRHVLRIMMMISEVLHNGGVGRALLELVEERVLSCAWHDGARPGYPVGTFFRLAQHLAKEVRRSLGPEVFPFTTAARRREALLRLFKPFPRRDCFYGFNPLRVTVDAGPTSKQVLASPDIWLHSWAVEALERGGHRGAPPAAVWTGADLGDGG